MAFFAKIEKKHTQNRILCYNKKKACTGEKRMNTQSRTKIDKAKWALLTLVGVLMIWVMVAAANSRNVIVKADDDFSYSVAENVTFTQMEDKNAPTGVVDVYRFVLSDIENGDSLAFYISHHNIAVYLDEACVYTLAENGEMFRTTGGVWTMIPLDSGDVGKEVRIELTSRYSDYQKENMEFLIGSPYAIYRAEFYKAVPELLLSLCVVLMGLLLLVIGIYYSIKHIKVMRLCAIGLLAISAGVWRFTYGRFAYLLLEEHTVAVYYLSVVSLMVVALSLINSVDTMGSAKAKKIISLTSIIYCFLYFAQLLLQISGKMDLRQTLKITHGTIITSAIVLGISGTVAWIRSMGHGWGKQQNFSWLLGVGVLVDLFLYYFTSTSYSMIFTLGAILCFSILEGVCLLNRSVERKAEMERMESQLIISRTTVLMSQIRSHFVFNVLNAISGMCKYDPEKADETVVRFARYLRNNIDIMEEDKNVPFSKELRQLEDYVALEQVRFGDKVSFYADIETDDFELPPLILQPLVENAIKHGISKKLTDGTIILHTYRQGDNIVITVEDDGVGFDMKELEKTQSVGLRNIRFRLEHLANGKLDITSVVGKGTTATITIPRENDQCT